MTKLLAFDLETTGLDTGQDRIIEFCFLSLTEDLEINGRYHSLVNPERAIPPESSEIHGITDADVREKAPFKAHAHRIQELVKQATLIAHNGAFDMAVLNAELVRAGFQGLSPTHPLIDTLIIERYVNSHKLESAYERYEGKPFEQAHRADSDTEATVAVLRGQLRTHKNRLPQGLEQASASHIRRLAGHEEKEYLDHDHRFYRDNDGVVRFNFGQHRGEQVSAAKGYLEWMLRREFSEDTLRVVKAILNDSL